MTGTITLSAPFDMSTIDFGALENATDTLESSTEVDITAAGQSFVFTGTGLGEFDEGIPLAGTVTGFTIDNVVAVTNIVTDVVHLIDGGWKYVIDGGTVNGSSGNDVLEVGTRSVGFGNAGNDTINALNYGVTLIGGSGDDVLRGYVDEFGNQDTTVTYSGASSGVTIDLSLTTSQNVGGGLGHDTLITIANLTGSPFNDRLLGDGLNNVIDGGGGRDTIAGGGGNDTLIAYDATDTINGGPGDDTIQYMLSSGLTLDASTLRSVETIIATNFADTITAGAKSTTIEGLAGNDTLIGGAGADVLIGGPGNDILNGGAGSNTASYADAAARVTVNLAITGPQFVDGGDGHDTLTSIENLIGSGHADVLTGDVYNNHIDGGGGNDVLMGGAGNDVLTDSAGSNVLDGGAGADKLQASGGHDIFTGGTGSDKFVFDATDAIGNGTSGVTNTDVITDFDAAQDHLQFEILGTPFVPETVDILTSGTLNAATEQQDFNTALGSLAAHSAVLFTASSGDLVGTTYLIVNMNSISQSSIRGDVVIQLGDDSNLTGFGLHDFI